MQAIRENDTRTLSAIYALAVQYGATMLAEARSDAPWKDRTGNARSGLFYAVDGFGKGAKQRGGSVRNATTGGFEKGGGSQSQIEVGDNELVIVLGHTMHYGLYLELSMGGRYAIVWPTVSHNAPAFMADLKRLLEG
jgi:hypothetical protein